MTDKPYNEFDPDQVVCEVKATVSGQLLYTNFAPMTVKTIPNSAVMCAAIFHRLTNDAAFNDEMLQWAEDNLGVAQAGGH